MHRNEIFYALLSINIHVLSCLISILSHGGATGRGGGVASEHGGVTGRTCARCAGRTKELQGASEACGAHSGSVGRTGGTQNTPQPCGTHRDGARGAQGSWCGDSKVGGGAFWTSRDGRLEWAG